MKTYATAVISAVFAANLVAAEVNPADTTSPSKTTCELANDNGWVCTTHTVTTADGYILEFYNLPYVQGLKKNEIQKLPWKAPVLMMHNLGGESDLWVGDSMSPGFAVCEEFDCWFGNNRGNWYSNNHETLDIMDNEFWDFSFDEQVNYVGYSNGTTEMFVGLAKNPTLSDGTTKLSDIVGYAAMLSPCTKITGQTGAITMYNEIQELLDGFDIAYVGGEGFFQRADIAAICTLGGAGAEACALFQEIAADSKSAIPVKHFLHFWQTGLVDRFQEWSTFLPFATPNTENSQARFTDEYPLDMISVPLGMWVPEDDDLCPVANGRWARDQIGDEVVTYDEFSGGHGYWFEAAGIASGLFDDVLADLAMYAGKEITNCRGKIGTQCEGYKKNL